ncbi:MAG: NAD-dependent epimerase/dehydratase family protein [Pseudomonadota bacterium]
MRLLVTGHRGYIGCVLVPMLRAAGHDVVGLDSDIFSRCTYDAAGTMPVAPSIQKDIRDVEVSDFLGFDAVLHLAALSNDPLGNFRPEVTDAINYMGTVRVAEAAKKAGVSRFVFSSSCSNYGASGSAPIDETAAFNPVTPYGVSKVNSEKALRALADDDFCPVFLRSATAYGVSPRLRFDLVLNNLVAWAVTTGRIHMKSDGTPWRPIVHIEDISRAFLAVLEAPRDVVFNEAFNVGVTDHNYQIKEIAEAVAYVVPNCTVDFADGAGPDKRSYRVNCDKIRRVLPAFQPFWTPETGAEEIYKACVDGGLTLQEFEGPRYQRIGHLRELIDSGTLAGDLSFVKQEASVDERPSEAAGASLPSAAACTSCGEAGLKLILDLGTMPRSDGLIEPSRVDQSETLVPLRLGYCPNCTLVQLFETRPQEEMFGDEYLYFSSYSTDLLKHSRDHVLDLIERRELGSENFVVEVASNDGYLLSNFLEKGVPVLGIDPAPKPAATARERGIPTLEFFFGEKVATEVRNSHGAADVIIAKNVVAHATDTNDFVAGLSALVSDTGVVVTEFPYLRDLIEHTEFDTIYHEHLCYFSVGSAKYLFARHGLHLIDVERLSIHGGSLRMTFSKSGSASPMVDQILKEEQEIGLGEFSYYTDFAQRVRAFREDVRNLIGSLKADGHRLAAYGAAAKGTIMLNYLNLNDSVIEYVVDRNENKQGKLVPGVRIPIHEPDRLLQDKPDYVVVLPWNFRDEIISQQQEFLKGGGRFVVPIPKLEIVSA